MILVESVLGNVAEPHWKNQLEGATIDELKLDQWQAQKNRFRLKTEAGVELAVSLERNSHLHDGDLLAWDDTAKRAIVARIDLHDVMVVRLDGLLSQSQETLARTSVELGHALGNQHWPAVVKGTTVYVPLTVDRQVMASVMRTHAFEGITVEFAPGATVIPYLAPHEARRLFGGADSTPHSHLPAESLAHAHTHTPGHSHEHEHSHGQSPPHTHTHDHVPPHDHAH